MMADQCRYSRACAFERNVFNLDTGLLGHQAGSDMPNGTRSGSVSSIFSFLSRDITINPFPILYIIDSLS